MSEPPVIRPYEPSDSDWALALNNAAIPAVNGHDPATWAPLIEMSAQVFVAEREPFGRCGLMVLFAPGAPYNSLNYRWFSKRFDNFRYVDRVIVEAAARGHGIGNALYDAAIDACRNDHTEWLTCEVNEQPPNPASMRFHQRLGFDVVGRQETENGEKRVALLSRSIDPS